MLLNEDHLIEEIAILQKSLKVKNRLQKLLSYDQRPPRESSEPDLHTQNPRLNLLLKWCRTVCAFYNIKVTSQKKMDNIFIVAVHLMQKIVSSFCEFNKYL